MIIPTYNERPNIAPIVEAVLSLSIPVSILFVDDNSPDGTAEAIKMVQSHYPDTIFCLNRASKKGLAPAYLDGFEWALTQGFDYIYEMDCDFSHDPNELGTMSRLLESRAVDMVVGSRYMGGIRVSNWSKFRVLLSMAASLYVRCLTGISIKDVTAGYVGYSCSVIAEIVRNRDKITMNGYGFQVALKYLVWKKNYRFLEHPITFSERREGLSKMTGSIIFESLLHIPKLPFIRWR